MTAVFGGLDPVDALLSVLSSLVAYAIVMPTLSQKARKDGAPASVPAAHPLAHKLSGVGASLRTTERGSFLRSHDFLATGNRQTGDIRLTLSRIGET
jgi:hypothetical protein